MAWRDVVFGVGLIAIIVCLAWLFGPPELGRPPDPTVVQAYPRPDWYFLWYFAVLALLPHGAEAFIIICGPVAFGILLILLPFIANRGERYPLRRSWAIGAVLLAALTIGAFWMAGERAPWSPDFSAQPLPSQVVGAASRPIQQGAELFHGKGCEFCHTIAGHGGQRGPDLTDVGDRLTPQQSVIRTLNGGTNMPAYGGNLTPDQLNALTALLQARKAP